MTTKVKGISTRLDTREELNTIMKSKVLRKASSFTEWDIFEAVDFNEEYLFIEIIADDTRIGMSVDVNPNDDESSNLNDWSESFSHKLYPQHFLNILEEEEDYLNNLKHVHAFTLMTEY